MGGGVLIIEADATVAESIASAVRNRGFQPYVVSDGKEGYDLAQSERPAAIVLCAELPRVSGYSICAKLKKDPVLKDVPLVFTSSEAKESTFEHHKKLKVRADEYLSKPFDVSHLVELLTRHIRGSASMNGASHDDDIPISEDFGVEGAVDPFTEDPAFGSSDVAFDDAFGALEAIQRSSSDSIDLSLGVGLRTDVMPEEEHRPVHEAQTRVMMMPSSAAHDAVVHELKAQVEKLTQELEAERRSRAVSQGALSGIGGGRDVITLKKELNAKDRELFDLKDQLHARDREMLAMRDHETELEGRVMQAEEEVASWRRRAEDAKRSVEGLEREQHSARAELDKVRQHSADGERSLQEARSRQEDLARQLEELRARWKDLEQRARRHEEESSELRRRLQEAESIAGRARRALETSLDLLKELDAG
ncbi:MAG: response regulator [Myxococcales bacterium]|nr:response regulator [Myxococcales bacterium]